MGARTWVIDDPTNDRFPLWTRGNVGEVFLQQGVAGRDRRCELQTGAGNSVYSPVTRSY